MCAMSANVNIKNERNMKTCAAFPLYLHFSGVSKLSSSRTALSFGSSGSATRNLTREEPRKRKVNTEERSSRDAATVSTSVARAEEDDALGLLCDVRIVVAFPRLKQHLFH